MEWIMAPPARYRDENLRAAFVAAVEHLAKRPPNVIYAVVEFDRLARRAMGDAWTSGAEDRRRLAEIKRCRDPAIALAGLASFFWLPADVRALASDPEAALRMFDGRGALAWRV